MEETDGIGVDYIVETKVIYAATTTNESLINNNKSSDEKVVEEEVENNITSAAAVQVDEVVMSDTNPFGNPFKNENDNNNNNNHQMAFDGLPVAKISSSSTSSSTTSTSFLNNTFSTLVLNPIERKRSLLKSLGAHGSWVTRSKSMQLDPDETEILNFKNGSISFIFTQAWLLSPSKQGKFMHILDTVMRSVGGR